jgi:hypothetical protein
LVFEPNIRLKEPDEDMNRIRKIAYSACVVLCTTLVGCLREVEIPTPADDGLVPVELVALGSDVEVTRAGIDPSYTTINSATIIVFHATEDRVLQNRYLADVTTDKIYLKKGETYRVFAVANLADANCPNNNASTYFADVDSTTDLDGKYFIASPAGTAPALMPMTSIGSVPTDLTTQIVTVVVPPPSLIAPVPPAVEYSVTIQMRSIYTKVELNFYNKTDSGVTPQSYLIESLPTGSWIIERDQSGAANYDYADYLGTLTPPQIGYVATSLKTFANGGWTAAPAPYDGYEMQTITFYTLENRRGTDGSVTNEADRKENAPANALELTFISEANSKLLYTYVHVGQGREAETPTTDAVNNYDVDRNCIYHVNIYINGTANVVTDSRREYLDVVAVCGDLIPPTDGTAGEF